LDEYTRENNFVSTSASVDESTIARFDGRRLIQPLAPAVLTALRHDLREYSC